MVACSVCSVVWRSVFWYSEAVAALMTDIRVTVWRGAPWMREMREIRKTLPRIRPRLQVRRGEAVSLQTASGVENSGGWHASRRHQFRKGQSGYAAIPRSEGQSIVVEICRHECNAESWYLNWWCLPTISCLFNLYNHSLVYLPSRYIWKKYNSGCLHQMFCCTSYWHDDGK